ncbi:inactive pancreatic lipase-related protein 1-like [Aphis craccivora]|uniref:Inactive pancreatic lipase-related protein 1-like n=1 Tax=Aphis craccivora TaxID=307492 RepID=A0A6G0YMV8_APHCR|nr:inactive pancreatic lipase-related protein 1-like [Aphis craccivora]
MGEIQCQGRDATVARLQTPQPRGRAIPIASANGGTAANSISRPTKQQQQDAISKQTTPAPPVSVKELFNSSSCVEPPFTCPHPRIQFYLYTRL